jgi:hypothetical protein
MTPKVHSHSPRNTGAAKFSSWAGSGGDLINTPETTNDKRQVKYKGEIKSKRKQEKNKNKNKNKNRNRNQNRNKNKKKNRNKNRDVAVQVPN